MVDCLCFLCIAAVRREESLVGHTLVSRRVNNGDVKTWWECRTEVKPGIGWTAEVTNGRRGMPPT